MIIERHVGPDGVLTFVVERLDDGVHLPAFEQGAWHLQGSDRDDWRDTGPCSSRAGPRRDGDHQDPEDLWALGYGCLDETSLTEEARS